MSEQNIIINPQRLRQLVRSLIDIYSPSGKEEEILTYLHEYLQRHGIPVIRQTVDDTRHNLIVVPPNSEPRLALVGHLDTVAAYDLDHYGYEEKDDLIIGLGAADMKGGCAAIVEAYVSLWEAGVSGLPVALVLLVGEEEEGDGAERLVEEYHFPWAIIAEPTDLYPCLSHYGYLEVQLGAEGKRLHASLASRDQNPVESMLHLLLQISHYMVQQQPDGTYNIRDLLSTQSGFAVPEWCEAWLDVHLPPNAPLGKISLELEEIVEQCRRENLQVETTIRFATIEGGYELPERGLVVSALKDLYNKRCLHWMAEVFRSHSDANQLWASGIKPILLGPGHLSKAHAPDESVPFQQILLAAEVYRDLAISLTQ